MLKQKNYSNKRAESELLKAVNHILRFNIHDHHLTNLCVTKVELSKDKKSARVYILVHKNAAFVIKRLSYIKKTIRFYLGKQLTNKLIPNLYFHADKSLSMVKKIEDLISQTKFTSGNDDESDTELEDISE